MRNDFLKYKAAIEPGDHPTWDRILDHCGQSLDDVLKVSEWGQDTGVLTGQQYLMIWIAHLLRTPVLPLPYLFFYGNQNCGKSAFNESVCVLLTRNRYIQADWSVGSGYKRSPFNSELDGTLFCYLDESDLTDGGRCDLDYFKKVVTSTTINIHKMRVKPYVVPNLTHWCQTANTIAARPTCLGNRVITSIQVDDLASGTEIPKRNLLAQLRDEAPNFMYTIMQLARPPLENGLGLPVFNCD